MASKLLMAKSPAEAVSAKNAQAAFLAGGTEVNRLGTSVDAEMLISLKKCINISARKLVGITHVFIFAF